MTVKEIIDRAIAQSQGRFKPAPSTIYPILGKLLDEGLAEGSKDGRYAITRKGWIWLQIYTLLPLKPFKNK